MLPSTTIRNADLDDAAATLTLEWGDGLRAVYPLRFLRAECPCATCRETRSAASKNPFTVFTTAMAEPSCAVIGVEPVGRYGLRFTWGDRHDTGIYTFEFLRELAERPEVRKAPPPEDR